MLNPIRILLNQSGKRFMVSALLAVSSIATWAADDYPSRPIRLLQSYPAGGSSDFLARVVAGAMSTTLNQNVLVDNRPGASGMIAADQLARATPDGYTLWQGDIGAMVFNPLIYKKVPYKTADLASVGLMARFNMVWVANTRIEAKSAKEAIGLIRRNPGKFNFGSVGVGSPHHFAFELLKRAAALDMVHVPYKGTAPAVQDISAGVVPFMFLDNVAAEAQAKSGKIRILAVASSHRLPQFPDTPTFAELGMKEVEVYAWQGLTVPNKTPQPIVNLLNVHLRKALDAPEIRKKLTEFGLEITPSSPAEMDAYVNSQAKFWGDFFRSANLKIEM